jgi:hypothetical protein
MNGKIINIIGSKEVIDNWGNTNVYNVQETYKILITPEEWTDDITFYDDEERPYDIDDLIGKKVCVGPFIFTIQDVE